MYFSFRRKTSTTLYFHADKRSCKGNAELLSSPLRPPPPTPCDAMLFHELNLQVVQPVAAPLQQAFLGGGLRKKMKKTLPSACLLSCCCCSSCCTEVCFWMLRSVSSAHSFVVRGDATEVSADLFDWKCWELCDFDSRFWRLTPILLLDCGCAKSPWFLWQRMSPSLMPSDFTSTRLWQSQMPSQPFGLRSCAFPLSSSARNRNM